jgi:hypothetical protein
MNRITQNVAPYSSIFGIFLLLGVLTCSLFLCSCQQEQTQAQPEQLEQFGPSKEPDVIQTILDQNVQLTEENNRLIAELEQLKRQPLETQPPPEQPSLEQPSLAKTASYQPPASPADAWQQIQEIANRNMVDGEQKTQFLQESSNLIKQWEEAQTAIQTQREAIDYLETIQGEEPQAIAKLADAKQKITELEAIANQAQRDLDTLIAPYRKLQSLPIATEPQYGNLAVGSRIEMTPEGEFLVTIRYNKDNAALTDTFNLNAGQGKSAEMYPSAFCRSIYRQIGRMRRAGMVTWSRQVTMQERIDFTNIITNMPRTMTVNGY